LGTAVSYYYLLIPFLNFCAIRKGFIKKKLRISLNHTSQSSFQLNSDFSVVFVDIKKKKTKLENFFSRGTLEYVGLEEKTLDCITFDT